MLQALDHIQIKAPGKTQVVRQYSAQVEYPVYDWETQTETWMEDTISGLLTIEGPGEMVLAWELADIFAGSMGGYVASISSATGEVTTFPPRNRRLVTVPDGMVHFWVNLEKQSTDPEVGTVITEQVVDVLVRSQPGCWDQAVEVCNIAYRDWTVTNIANAADPFEEF